MDSLQATFEIAVDLGHTFDLDLCHRGSYFISVEFEDSQVTRSNIEVHLLNAGNKKNHYPAAVSKHVAYSSIFQRIARHQDAALDNSFLFRCHRLIDSENIVDSLNSMTFLLNVKLYFYAGFDLSDVKRESFDVESERVLQLNIDPVQGLHGYTMLLFDYSFMAAVEMTVHACIVGLHQPLLQTLIVCQNSKPNEKDKVTLETILFPISPNLTSLSSQLSHAIDIHNSIINILYAIYVYLKSYLIVLSEKLPEKCKNSHEYSTALMKICNMEETIKQAKTKEEMLDQANMNLASACSYVLALWSYILDIVCLNRNIMNDLAFLSHKQRIQRFQSFFFTTDNPRSLFDEQRSGFYNSIANEIRSSNYCSSLSPLLVEAQENDGTFPLLPIVFEDQYLSDCNVIPVFKEKSNGITRSNHKMPISSHANSLYDSAHNSSSAHNGTTAIQDSGFRSFSQDIFTNTLEEPDELPTFQSLLSAPGTPTHCLNGNFSGPGYKSQSTESMQENKQQKSKFKSSNGTLVNGSNAKNVSVQSNSIIYSDNFQSKVAIENSEKKGKTSSSENGRDLMTFEAFLNEDWDLTSEDCFDYQDDLTHTCNSCHYLNEVQNVTPSIPTASGLWKKLEFKHVAAKNKLLEELQFPGHLYSDLYLTIPITPYITSKAVSVSESKPDSHLIVLVHGLDGTESDMRIVRSYLLLGIQGILRSRGKWNISRMPYKFLMSSANASDTTEDMRILSKRLEEEILDYISSNYHSSSEPKRISFIGHSLGGVLLRSAMASDSMKHLRSRFHTFLSFASPHLGTIFNNSSLVNTGLWLMQKLRRSTCLRQLSCKEDSNFRNTFIYKLSEKPALEFLKNILLVASAEDKYVPYHSARIEMCKAALKDKTLGSFYNEMINNLLSPVHDSPKINLLRYHVVHSLPSFTADSYIGRSAHIAPLESCVFLEQFLLVTALQYFV